MDIGLESFDDGLGLPLHLFKRLEGGMPTSTMVEEYRTGKRDLHIGLGGLGLGEGEDDQWCIAYRRAFMGQNIHESAIGWLVEHDAGFGQCPRGWHWDAMLVGVVETPEHTKYGIPSVARLRRLNDCPHVFGQAADTELSSFPTVFRLRDWEGEQTVVGRGEGAGCSQRNSVDGVVKCATETVGEISNNGPPTPIRVGPAIKDIDRCLRLIRIELGVDSCSVSFRETPHVAPQFIQVISCPVQSGLDELNENGRVRVHERFPFAVSNPQGEDTARGQEVVSG